MSKSLSAVDCIAPAFAQTKKQLFTPFRWARWWRLAVVCLVTGEFAGGGAGGGPSGNFHFPAGRGTGRKAFLDMRHVDWSKVLPWLPWIIAGIFLLVAIIFVCMYIASVFRFVLFESVLYDRCELKGSWARWEPSGRSYFLWTIALFAVAAAGSLVVIGLPVLLAWRAGLFQHPGEHLLVLILCGLALFFLFIAFVVSAGIVGLFAKDFCVPIMGMEKIGVLAAWRRLMPMLAAEKMAFSGYVLMKIVLAIGNAIIVGIVTIFTLLILLIPLGIAALIIFLGGKIAGLAFNVATISILTILGGILLAGVIYLVALINTAPMVFFQSYVLHFIGSRYPAVGAVLFPPPNLPPAPALEMPPGTEPPPETAPAG